MVGHEVEDQGLANIPLPAGRGASGALAIRFLFRIRDPLLF